MKQLAFILTIVLSLGLFSCSSSKEEQTPEIKTYVEGLMEKYPNFHSNELAKTAFMDSISHKCESYIGKQATILNGIEFQFVKIIENPQTGAKSALMKSNSCMAQIESDAEGKKYIISSLGFQVLGIVDETTAASLSSGYTYSVTGTVHAWDDGDVFYSLTLTPDDIYMGSFVLNDMVVKKIEKD